tara:strand:+ start:1322 stop:1939 length:618 start_codon:yes stop_codon:yes gene_type:complete
MKYIFHSQDIKQAISVPFYFITEAYQVFLASMPLFFVPIVCNEEICTPVHNLKKTNNIGITLHFITFLSLLTGYTIELYREYWCINYLDVNNNIADNSFTIDVKLKNKLKNINNKYEIIWFSSFLCFLLNIGYSSFRLRHHFIDSYDSLITYIAFISYIFKKYISVLGISYDFFKHKHINISSYLTENVKYNIEQQTISTDFTIN